MTGTGSGTEGTDADPVAAIRRRLDEARCRRGWTLRDMARATGYPRSTLQYLLHRRQRVPDYFELQALVSKLGEEWDDGWDELWQHAVQSQRAGDTPAQTPVPRQLPAAMTSFIGRATELDDLDSALLPGTGKGSSAKVVAIVGGGGVGKTTLALQWARTHSDRYPDGQLYVDLRGFDPAEPAAAPAAVLKTFLVALGVEPSAVPATLADLTAQYRTLVAEKSLLVVLDNARDSAQVTPLLPGGARSATVITSRSGLAELAVRGARTLPLDVFGAADARRLLLDGIDSARSGDADAITALLTWCDGLPLALRIVAARAASQPHLPLDVLVEDLRDEGERLDALDAGELRANVRAVFSCSYRALPAPAAEAFRLFGLTSGPDLGLTAAASLCGRPVAAIKPVLRTLVASHLAAEHSPGRFRMHDLVRLYARAQAGRETEAGAKQAAMRRLADHYLQHVRMANGQLCPHRRPIAIPPQLAEVTTTPITSFQQALDWCEAEHGNMVALITEAPRLGLYEYAWQLTYCLWSFYNLRRYWDDSLATGLAALTAAEAVGDEWAQAAILTILGNTCRERRDLEQALAHHLHALEIRRSSGDRRGEGITLGNLGNVYKDLGRFAEALDCYRQDLAICEPEDPWSASITLGNLGLVQAELGRFDDALGCHQKDLDISRAIGNRHGEGVALSNLGQVLHRLGRLDEATERLVAAVPVLREVGDRCAVAATHADLGAVWYDRAEPGRARECWRLALAIFEELDDPRTEEVSASLARLEPDPSPPRRGRRAAAAR